jgi:hypothetical protein
VVHSVNSFAGKPAQVLAFFADQKRRGENCRGWEWRAMPDDDEHYVYAIAL